MIRARWNGRVIAESDDTVVVDGNHYFKPDDVLQSALRPSETTSVCGWKGTAEYYDVVVGEDVNSDAAWYYATPKEEAAEIAGRIAFWKGVAIADES